MDSIRNRMMILIFCSLLLSGNSGLCAQETIFSSYEKNFIRASLAAKNEVLKDAEMDDSSGEFIGALYDLALGFVLANGAVLQNDPDMIALVSAAVKGSSGAGNTASVAKLWTLFQVFHDPYSRIEILEALAVLGKGNAEFIESINEFVMEQNNYYRRYSNLSAGMDYSVLRAGIDTLGALGDDSSFPVLFSAMTAGYPQVVTGNILQALESIDGDFKEYLIEIIHKSSFAEKTAAFRIGAYNDKLQPTEVGELAQATLEISLENSGPTELSLRYDAIAVLTKLKWSPAAPLAIKNYYQVQTDYSGGAVQKERLLEAIACLGVMSSTDAAQALALQLGYANSRTEKTGVYDEAVILAIINALGELADKAAFDNLLYVGYLNYPASIQTAAREALNRLKWQ